MASELIRCTDCGATFKGVPIWLATAKVKFTCTNCPKRPSRAVARFEPPATTAAALDTDADADIDAVEIDDMDEEADIDLGADDLEDAKDEKE